MCDWCQHLGSPVDDNIWLAMTTTDICHVLLGEACIASLGRGRIMVILNAYAVKTCWLPTKFISEVFLQNLYCILGHGQDHHVIFVFGVKLGRNNKTDPTTSNNEKTKIKLPLNSFTTIRVRTGTKHSRSRPVGFLR